MQRLAFFFFSSLIVPFVLVSIISLFGLADFQLEVLLLEQSSCSAAGGVVGGCGIAEDTGLVHVICC